MDRSTSEGAAFERFAIARVSGSSMTKDLRCEKLRLFREEDKKQLLEDR